MVFKPVEPYQPRSSLLTFMIFESCGDSPIRLQKIMAISSISLPNDYFWE